MRRRASLHGQGWRVAGRFGRRGGADGRILAAPFAYPPLPAPAPHSAAAVVTLTASRPGGTRRLKRRRLRRREEPRMAEVAGQEPVPACPGADVFVQAGEATLIQGLHGAQDRAGPCLPGPDRQRRATKPPRTPPR